ncbi:hypothetical protein AA309_14820 [Microvirga vignae]|uniref:Uncharacterized protein n=1 Tax=Microvirga vignae TaxID=1225564 RepID=A0A0H1RB14_9HYPH|nr:hypothetical protein AA309_14820 [Microvirga vignae]
MPAWMSILRQNDMSNGLGQPVGGLDDCVPIRHGKCAAREDVILNIHDHRDVRITQFDRVLLGHLQRPRLTRELS